MDKLLFDAGALCLLDRCRSGQGVLITSVNNYGLPGESLTAERCSRTLAEHDPDLILFERIREVPIYVHRRIAAYAYWHPLKVTTQGLGPWRYFAVAREDEVWRDLLRWEQLHPARYTPAPPRAA